MRTRTVRLFGGPCDGQTVKVSDACRTIEIPSLEVLGTDGFGIEIQSPFAVRYLVEGDRAYFQGRPTGRVLAGGRERPFARVPVGHSH